jgi:hypothetical protein
MICPGNRELFENPRQQRDAPVAGYTCKYHYQYEDENRDEDGEFLFHDTFCSRKLKAGVISIIFKPYRLQLFDGCPPGRHFMIPMRCSRVRWRSATPSV